MSFFKCCVLSLAIIAVSITATDASARTKDTQKNTKEDQVLRAARGILDLQQNKVSNISFYTTNYGIFGLNVAANVGGGYWPRGSGNQYIFGGGIWFAGLKLKAGETSPRKLAVISYNPNSGISWMSPGRIEDGPKTDPAGMAKYRTYFSTDFDQDGAPFVKSDGPNWPIWDTQPFPDTLKRDRYFGNYVNDVSQRNRNTYPKGPAYISEEDIISVFKDTDLSRYEISNKVATEAGFPMQLQFEQTIYSWGFGDYKDFIFLKYVIVNKSNDTIRECYMAPAMDMDIATSNNVSDGAQNDHTKFYDADPSLNLAVQWSDGNRQENGRGFGYIGFDFLESPAVDAGGNIRRDKKIYENTEQLGLHTFRNWTIDIDPLTSDSRYDFMSTGLRDGDNGPGDKRFLMSTGPFIMKPQDTARVVVGLIMANATTPAAIASSPTGTEEDLIELIRKDKFAQSVYDNNFKAPKPPDAPRMSFESIVNGDTVLTTWEPINNGVIVRWDSTSEMSYDDLERGLDFLGYRLYRARNKDLDSFDVNNITLPLGRPDPRGPDGWKQIATWQMPYPFIKSAERREPGNVASPFFDQIVPLSQSADKYTIEVMRLGTGIDTAFTYTSTTAALAGYQYDLTNEPWGVFYSKSNFQSLLDTVFKGQILIDRTVTDTALIPVLTNLQNPTQRAAVVSKIFNLVRLQKAQIIFPEFEDKKSIRDGVIVPYMRKLTNNRTFVDIGDDNRNGVVETTTDENTTETLINGLDYYYRLDAYDEGDYRQTPQKVSTRVLDRNIIRTTPGAARASGDVSVRKIDSTEDLLGGISNFQFIIKDQQRVQQLFAGHTLEVEFKPVVGITGAFMSKREIAAGLLGNGLYGSEIIFKDLTTGQELARYNTYFEPTQCGSIVGSFSENAAIFIGDTAVCDTCPDKNFAEPNNIEERSRAGTFTTDAVCNGSDRFVYNALGFTFDYNFIQQGGVYRPFSATITKGSATPSIVSFSPTDTELTQPKNGEFRRFNEGPASYLVQFLSGGNEQLNLTFGRSPAATKAFDVSYLNTRVWKITHDTLSNGKFVGDTVEITNIVLAPPIGEGIYLSSTDVPINSFNLSAYGWVDGDSSNTALNRRRQSTQEAEIKTFPVGTQGRYYLTGRSTDGANVVKFTHVFLTSGTTFGIDFANKQGRRGADASLFAVQAETPTVDFAAGDEVIFRTFGGAVGLPKAGAFIRAKVDSAASINTYSDEILDQIRVVPNPYYVNHRGQKSPYDAKIYFTKLPVECTISIYTINGDLIRTIEHNESAIPEETRSFSEASDVWDLLSDNKQRVASQVLIAKIETPNGASTILKFAVITGGFRTVPE